MSYGIHLHEVIYTRVFEFAFDLWNSEAERHSACWMFGFIAVVAITTPKTNMIVFVLPSDDSLKITARKLAAS